MDALHVTLDPIALLRDMRALQAKLAGLADRPVIEENAPTAPALTPEEIKAMRAEGVLFRCHSFESACADLHIEHHLTKPRHTWTNGQLERMNRTIKDATGSACAWVSYASRRVVVERDASIVRPPQRVSMWRKASPRFERPGI